MILDVYVVDSKAFHNHRYLLDGFVFWRPYLSSWVEVKQIAPSSRVSQILNNLKLELP